MDAYWEQRVANIKDSVKIRDVVDHFNVFCQSAGDETQLHCPFHGHDNHASARIYSSNTMYCWVCNKVWDVISFVRDLNDTEFSEACNYLENLYGLEKVDKSLAYVPKETLAQYLDNSMAGIIEKDFERDFEKINNYLLIHKSSLGMTKYVSLFSQYDSVYSAYKTDVFSKEEDLVNALTSLTRDITGSV